MSSSLAGVHYQEFTNVKVNHMTGQWSRDALLVHLFSRQYLGEKSAISQREIIVVWTVLISRWEIGEIADFSPISRREITVMWTGQYTKIQKSGSKHTS